MLFNSYIFVFMFFPLVVLGYYGLHRLGWKSAALGYLTLMSMVFYGYNSFEYLIMLIVSILVNYLLVRLMDKTGGVWRRSCLLVGLLYNLGILFYFKYYDFFIENVNAVLDTDYHFLRLALPLGISFYTFQQISYVIDSYRGDCARYSFLEYAAYVSFFPQLIAGPIVYHDELIPRLRAQENHHDTLVDVAAAEKDKATQDFLWGFVREQVEEEATAAGIVDMMKKAGTNGIFFVDVKLGERK